MTGAIMFNVTFMTGSRTVGSDTFRGSLDIAKAIAIASVDKGSAEGAKIHDINNTLVFQYRKAIRAL